MARAYLVRVKADRQLVGFFFCERRDLSDFVDEDCSPTECEATLCPAGGVTWPYRTEQRIPHHWGDEGENDLALDGAALTESWSDLIGLDDLKWFDLEIP
jgi:hypothetical protein